MHAAQHFFCTIAVFVAFSGIVEEHGANRRIRHSFGKHVFFSLAWHVKRSYVSDKQWHITGCCSHIFNTCRTPWRLKANHACRHPILPFDIEDSYVLCFDFFFPSCMGCTSGLHLFKNPGTFWVKCNIWTWNGYVHEDFPPWKIVLEWHHRIYHQTKGEISSRQCSVLPYLNQGHHQTTTCKLWHIVDGRNLANERLSLVVYPLAGYETSQVFSSISV